MVFVTTTTYVEVGSQKPVSGQDEGYMYLCIYARSMWEGSKRWKWGSESECDTERVAGTRGGAAMKKHSKRAVQEARTRKLRKLQQ